MTWNGPLAWRLAVTATDGGQHPQEKDKLSDKHAARYRTSAGRQAPERGGMGLGIKKEKESRGSRQQMNLHLCREASRDITEKISQTAIEVQLWAHSSCGFSPLKVNFYAFALCVY